MYLPKHDIFTALSTVTSTPAITVLQGSQKTIAKVPSITFFISDNVTDLDLGNEIASQTIEATIDIWAKDSAKADSIFTQVETKMRALGYRLNYSTDVPDPNPKVCHVNTRFEGIK